MSNDSKKRVLGRTGAHELTPQDLEKVNGAKATVATKLLTGTISNPDSIVDQ